MHALILALALSSLGAGAQAPVRFAVFVKSPAATAGFTDPSKDRADSIRDMESKIENSKVLFLAESEADAVIVLDVLGRETNREVNVWGRQNKSVLTVRLTVGEYSTEFSGDGGSSGIFTGYAAAAGKVVKQIEKWAKANTEQLLAKAVKCPD
jgi:hypothetical protein